MKPLFEQDLQHVVQYASPALLALRNGRLFITGGTGFFGKWLLETFAYANRELSLHAKAVVLSRNPARFLAEMPHLANEDCLEYVQGDVTSFAFPQGDFQWVIHGAAELGTRPNDRDPVHILDIAIGGTRRVLDLAARGGCAGFLLTGSGAAYGRQPSNLTHVSEDYSGAPDPMDANMAYGQGKRLAEHLCHIYCQDRRVPARIARCFAFVGPHLPLEGHFAIGNFLRDALAGGPIRVEGDGTACRSYLYASDLMVWLWTILVRGKCSYPYNVGSDEAITIANLAERIAKLSNTTAIVARAATPGAAVSRYVPCVRRAHELDLVRRIDLDAAIERTKLWLTQPSSLG